MDMNALKEAIDQGFENLESGLVEKFREVQKQFGEVQKQFGEVRKQFGAVHKRIDGTEALIEDLRHDLKIFGEDSTPGSVIPLAQRVTDLERRVKKLETPG